MTNITYSTDIIRYPWFGWGLTRYFNVSISGPTSDEVDIITLKQDMRPLFFWTRRGLEEAVNDWESRND